MTDKLEVINVEAKYAAIDEVVETDRDIKSYIFEVVIEPDEDVFHAYCPNLKGCRTWGHTKREALKYIQEAVELYIEDLIADGKPIPGVGLVKNIRPIVKIINTQDNNI